MKPSINPFVCLYADDLKSIATNPSEGFIYFTRNVRSKPRFAVFRIRQNGSDYGEFIQTNIGHIWITSITFDWITGQYLYINTLIYILIR